MNDIRNDNWFKTDLLRFLFSLNMYMYKFIVNIIIYCIKLTASLSSLKIVIHPVSGVLKTRSE
ncbi:Uncharacterised protein g7596 [Pycnogonum litorale]